MTMTEFGTAGLQYVRVGGPPMDWKKVEVCCNGQWSKGWIEVDVVEGYGMRLACDAEGRMIIEDEKIKRERVDGEFQLRLKGDDDD